MLISANLLLRKFIFKYLFYGYIISIFVLSFYASFDYILFYVIIGFLISYIVKQTIKYSNYIYSSVMAMFIYIGYLLQFPIIVINEEKYRYGSLTSLGLFDFKIQSFMYVYFYVISFLLINFVWGILYKTEKKFLMLEKNYIKSKLNKYFLIIIVIVFVQFFINFFMFYHKIGIPGLVPEKLPFKISGLLYYYRFFVYPILIVYLINKGNIKSKFIIIILIIEMLQASLLSSSKAIVLLHTMPIFYIFFREGKIKMIIILFLTNLLLFPFVALGRNIYYHVENLNLSIFVQAIDYILNTDFDQNVIGYGVTLFINRMVGLKEFIMTNFSPCKYSDIMYYFTSYWMLPKHLAASLNMDCMYGFEISNINKNGFAFGYVLDILSRIKLSSSNYFVFLLASSLHTFIFFLIEKLYFRVLNPFVKNKSLLIMFIMFITFMTITSAYVRKVVYLLMIVYIVKKFLTTLSKKSSKAFYENNASYSLYKK